MKATIRDVAQHAGVSIGSVSRVLNDVPSAGSAVTQRVLKAVRDLGYKPLRRRTASATCGVLGDKKIALVLLGMHNTLVSLPTVANAIEGAESSLSAAGAMPLLCNVPDPRSVPEYLFTSQIDAMIVKGALQGRLLAESTGAILDRMRQVPSVWLLGRPEGCMGCCVSSDEEAAGRIAAEYLVKHGHRRLAFLNPKPDHVLFARRQMAFEWHAQQSGASVELFVPEQQEQWTLPLHPVESVEAIQHLLERLIASRPRPTAVFCPADSISRVLYKACAMSGILPGRDISIISANRENASLMLHPLLTSVDIFPEAIGRRTVELLEWRITHPDEPEIQIAVAPAIVEGQSVATLENQRAVGKQSKKGKR